MLKERIKYVIEHLKCELKYALTQAWLAKLLKKGLFVTHVIRRNIAC